MTERCAVSEALRDHDIPDATEFSDQDIRIAAEQEVDEALGDDISEEDYESLCADLSISNEDCKGMIAEYHKDRAKWLTYMYSRSEMFWKDRIQERLERGE